MIRHLFPEHKFVSLDRPAYAEQAENNPELFLEKFAPPIIIDEVQYAPHIFRHLKLWIDEHRERRGQVILTGSQKFSLMKGVSESLAGRCAILELETLSHQEVARVHNGDALSMMIKGGFPELYVEKQMDLALFYDSYLGTYLERDVRSLVKVHQLRDFDRFIRALAFRSGQVLNKSEIARDVGVSASTVNEWVSVLEASNQVFLLEPWFQNRTKSLIKSPKLYFADTGLLCHLLGYRETGQLLGSSALGAIWETFVFSELRKRQREANGNWELWFWRDKYGLEVDFLARQGGKFQLMECKFSEQPGKKDLQNLLKVRELIGADQVDRILVLCRTQADYSLGPAEIHNLFS